jgi:N-acetylglutamate synthase-like GNAT family acetyltransferase
MVKEVHADRADEILDVINTSNYEAYHGVIPPEHFREPVLTEEELLEDFEGMVFYGWESNSKIVGVSALQFLDEGVGRVRYVYILPGYQRQGIGTALVTQVERKAMEMDLSKLKVLTVEKADWAVAFYKKLGFRLAERIERPWGFDVFLEKEL